MNRVCSWAFPFLLAFASILIGDFRPTLAMRVGDSRAAPSALDKMISDQAVVLEEKLSLSRTWTKSRNRTFSAKRSL